MSRQEVQSTSGLGRRHFLKLAGIALFLTAGPAFADKAAPPEKKPNILFFFGSSG